MRAQLSDQRVNDITPAKHMPITPGMTYVFDMAYYDFAWWAELDARGCRFVTRLKANTVLKVTAEQAVPQTGGVLSDRIGTLPQRIARSRPNPLADPLREITVRIGSGKTIRVLTNDLDAPACETAVKRPRTFITLIRLNLMHNRPINALKTPPSRPKSDPRQLSMNLEET